MSQANLFENYLGIDLWFKTRFVMQRPPIFKVNVLNFKSIMFAVKKSGYPVHPDQKIIFKKIGLAHITSRKKPVYGLFERLSH